MNPNISRRSFLKLTGGLIVAVSVTPVGYTILNAAEKKALKTFSPNAWLHITSDNKITIYIGNSEMGQGVLTAQPMIIADELEADWKQIKVKQAPTADAFKSPILGSQITVGSASLRGFYEPLRKTGAAGKAMRMPA